jgi:hypothetical protein
MAADPYAVLGVEPGVTDAELRAAYRRLVQLHHPDHNGGSVESAARFAAVQTAYTDVLARRRTRAAAAAPPPTRGAPRDPDLEARLAALERELQEQRQAAARAAAAAAAAVRAASPQPPRASPEELGYVTTDDTLAQIIEDAEAELAGRFNRARRDAARSPLAKRLTDLFAGPGDADD